jgi:hypothetical protein
LREPLATLARLALGGGAVLAACAREEPAQPEGATLEVRWVGSDTGELVAPAVAEWCDSLRLLELRAMHGDTGIAFALYPADSLTPGDYPVVAPERGDSARPAAAVALRYFAETSIRGFRGDSGSVRLAASGPGAGTFTAQLRSATEGSRLTATGSFRGLAITAAPPGCAGAGVDVDDPETGEDEEFVETPD